MNKLLLLIFATMVAIMPVFLVKQYTATHNTIYLLFAIICYLTLLYMYILIFREYTMASNYVLLQIMQIITVIIGSVVLFNETLNNMQIMGLITGITSIYLLA